MGARWQLGKEFKLEARKLVKERGVSVVQAARDLDVREHVADERGFAPRLWRPYRAKTKSNAERFNWLGCMSPRCLICTWVVPLAGMQASMTSQLVVDALMMTVWRRGRHQELLHHSDQGSFIRVSTSSGFCPSKASCVA